MNDMVDAVVTRVRTPTLEEMHALVEAERSRRGVLWIPSCVADGVEAAYVDGVGIAYRYQEAVVVTEYPGSYIGQSNGHYRLPGEKLPCFAIYDHLVAWAESLGLATRLERIA